MKYRMLTEEERLIFDEDFKHFLIANGVSSEEWLELNKSNKAGATTLVELFSDTVLQKVYEKVKFLEHRTKESCMVFKLNEAQIELVSLNLKPGSNEDLSTPDSIHEVLSNKPSQLTMFRTQKTYSKEREIEIHELIDQGCVNSSEAFWLSLLKTVEA